MIPISYTSSIQHTSKFYEKRYCGVGATGEGGGVGDDQSEVAAGRGGAQRRATRQTPTHPSECDTPPHFHRGDRGCVLVGRSLWHAGYPANQTRFKGLFLISFLNPFLRNFQELKSKSWITSTMGTSSRQPSSSSPC
jgi:hypothetical protein